MLAKRNTTLFILIAVFFLAAEWLLHSRQDVLPGHGSILPAPDHRTSVTNPPSPGVIDFWAQWAQVFEEAKPPIPPIEVENGASTADGLIPDNDDRTPTPTSVGLSAEDIESMRRSHEILNKSPLWADIHHAANKLYSGTGIVTVAGGKYYAPAIVSIRMLRKTNSTLPVQVFLQSASEYEPEICEELLPTLNAECFVIEDFLRNDAPFKVEHYQLKVLAMLFSSYDRILFLDSDCIPLHDPAMLLTEEPFTSHGLVSWPDYWIATEDPAFYTIAGMAEYPTGLPLRSSESGQLLFSKKRHLASLVLAAYYNVFGPSHFYPLLGQGAPGEGDKDTFLAAAVVRNETFYRVKTKTGTVGIKDHQGGFHGRGMVQHDVVEEWSLREFTHTAKPRPFFLHANLAKMNVARLLEKDDLFMPYTGEARERIRIWGTKERIMRTFDFDVEKVVWEEMVDMACTLDTVLRDFKKRRRLCEKAKEHFDVVFAREDDD